MKQYYNESKIKSAFPKIIPKLKFLINVHVSHSK